MSVQIFKQSIAILPLILRNKKVVEKVKSTLTMVLENTKPTTTSVMMPRITPLESAEKKRSRGLLVLGSINTSVPTSTPSIVTPLLISKDKKAVEKVRLILTTALENMRLTTTSVMMPRTTPLESAARKRLVAQ